MALKMLIVFAHSSFSLYTVVGINNRTLAIIGFHMTQVLELKLGANEEYDFVSGCHLDKRSTFNVQR